MSLYRTVSALKNKKTVYVDKVSSLAADLGYMTNPYVNKTLQLTVLTTFVMSLIACLLSIRNYYMLVLIVKPVTAFDWTQPTTTTDAPVSEHETIMMLGIGKVIECSSIPIVMLLLVRIVLTCLKRRTNSYIIKTKVLSEILIALYDGKGMTLKKVTFLF